MNWLNKLLPSRINTIGSSRRTVPEGVWTKCTNCNGVLYRAELVRNMEVCPKCGYHMLIHARPRLEKFLDEGSATEIGIGITPYDKYKFRDSKKYKDRLGQAQKATGEDDALVAMKGSVMTVPVVVCAFEFGFMGGSMGSVVGERFVLAVETCLEEGLPFVCFAASGGARMQEGLFSLMQMAKTSSALSQLRNRRLPYISVLTNPTTGGVSASLSTLGDINIAEPGALIGFAGPRVIEQTVRETLPEGFQRSEFLLEHGIIDIIVERNQLREQIASLLAMLMHKSTTSVSK